MSNAPRKRVSEAMPTMGPDSVVIRHIAKIDALDKAMVNEIKALKRDTRGHAHVEYKPSIWGIIFGKGK